MFSLAQSSLVFSDSSPITRMNLTSGQVLLRSTMNGYILLLWSLWLAAYSTTTSLFSASLRASSNSCTVWTFSTLSSFMSIPFPVNCSLLKAALEMNREPMGFWVLHWKTALELKEDLKRSRFLGINVVTWWTAKGEWDWTGSSFCRLISTATPVLNRQQHPDAIWLIFTDKSFLDTYLNLKLWIPYRYC